MKRIDLTKPGGFPLTQDQLGYLQAAYTECITAFAAMGGSGPCIISGCVVTKTLVSGTTYNYAITAGWVLYEGNMIKVGAGSLASIDESVNAAYMLITNTATPLTYNNGSTPNVILDAGITLVAQTIGTADDSTHFLLHELAPFGKGFGINNKEAAWNTLAVSTIAADGGVSGTVYYRKNFTTNTLQIRAFLSSANAQNFAASPAALYSLMGTLPAAYMPVNDTYFTGYTFGAGLIKDDLGVAWIKYITCGVNSAGGIAINWLRPDAAVAGYGVIFNTTIPLD